MENKFCLKSKQELAEIRQAKEEKKNSMSEISDELKDNALKTRYARLRKANDDHMKAMFRKVDGAEEVNAREKDLESAEKEMETQGKKIDRHLALRRRAQSESLLNEKSTRIPSDLLGLVTQISMNYGVKFDPTTKKYSVEDDETGDILVTGTANTIRKWAVENGAKKSMKDPGFKIDGAETLDQVYKRNWNKVIQGMSRNESLTASKALAMSKSILDEISDELANKALEKTVKETVKSNFSDESVDKEQKMIKQMILRKKRQGKELDQNEKEFLAKSESKINENDNVKNTMEKLYFFIRVEKEMRNSGEWGKDEYKDKAHKQSISDLFDELDKLGVGFGIQNSLVASAQSSNPDFSKWYAENVAKSESVNEELQVGDTARYNGHVWVKVKSIEGNKALVSPIHQEDVEKGNFGEEEFVMLDDLEKQPKLRESKINENESIPETIKEDIMNAVKERYGDDPDMLDWIYVDVERREDGYVRVELRAELDYEGMDNLIDYLKPIIKKYDKQAYFDMDSPGIAEVILEVGGIEESLNEDLAPEHAQEAYDKIEDIANDKLKELVRSHQDDDPEVDDIVGNAVMEYIKSIPSDEIVHLFLEMGFDEPQLVESMRNLVEPELISFFNKKLDLWKEDAYDEVAYGTDESLNAKTVLDKSKEILEGMIDKYGREVDPKEWEEKEAKGLNEEKITIYNTVPTSDEVPHDAEIKVFEPESKEYQTLEKAAGILTQKLGKSVIVGDTYFDYGSKWKWTTLLADSGSSLGRIQLVYPPEQRELLFGDFDRAINAIVADRGSKDNSDLDKAIADVVDSTIKSESKINEVSDELVDKAQNKALADVVNPGDEEKKTKGFKHLLSLEKLKQLRDKRKANKEDLK